MPDVTVVIPTRDRWPLLSGAALPSALEQEGVDLEVIVVDDGSAEELEAPRDDRVRVLRHERSRGVAAARNSGIGEAGADWVAFLDDDDLWAPQKLRLQLEAAGDAAWCYAGAVVLDGDLEPLRLQPIAEPAEVRQRLRHSNVVGSPSVVIAQRALLDEAGGFDERFSVLADWDLWLRVAEAAPAAACRETLVGQRAHGANMSVTRGRAVFDEFTQLQRKHRTELDAVDFQTWVAREQIQAGGRLPAARTYLSGALRQRSPLLVARAAAALAGRRVTRALRGPDQPPPARPAWVDRFRRG